MYIYNYVYISVMNLMIILGECMFVYVCVDKWTSFHL